MFTPSLISDEACVATLPISATSPELSSKLRSSS